MGYPCQPLCTEDCVFMVTGRIVPSIRWTLPMCRTCTLDLLFHDRVRRVDGADLQMLTKLSPYARQDTT
jgi:hypothetical protein